MATYQEWSESYFTNLTPDQHNANNRWFKSIRDKLTDSGILYVPILDKEFNKSGEEVNTNFDKSEDKVGTHKLQPISYYNHKVDVIEGDLITTEDENGNEILEDITEYEAHKIYQQMIRLSGGF